MKIFQKSLVFILLFTALAYGQLFINEIDYDQPGTDSEEFLEIAGPAGTYTNVRIELINGSTTPASMYKSVDISSLALTNEKDGYGFFVIGAASVANVDLTPSSWSIQNGSPDGIVLKINGLIVDAVSYEGPMIDENGNPMQMATPEGVDAIDDESGNTVSIQRLGLKGSPFHVALPTPGEANVDQIFEELNYAPVAKAGKDIVVGVNTEVTLDGSESYDSDGNITSYMWTQLSGTSVMLNNPNAAITTFTAPAIDSELKFRLEVTDNDGLTGDDTVAVSVVEVGESFIIISEYVEGSSNNKYLEIANVGHEAIDLNDAGYMLGQAVNGSGNFFDLTLTDWGHLKNLGPGEIIVLAADGHTIFANPDTVLLYPSVLHFNGNDAVALLKKGIVVDVVGDPNSSTDIIKDMTLRRKSSVTKGNPVFTLNEWTQLPTDDISGLGVHGGVDAPSFENAAHSPAFVTSLNAIEISIDIIPAENAPAIVAMDIEYGTGGNFLNTVGRDNTWNDHDNTWMGEIPAQAGNQRINYRFVAYDANENEYRSGVYYVLIASTTPTPIAEIHENIDAWDGQIKTIQGVMTIGANVIQTDRTNAYIQDVSGKGLNLYNPTLYSDLERGVEVTVVGEVDLYYTTIELKNFSYKITGTGKPLPEPISLTVSEANSDAWEGTLIKVTGTITAINPYSSNTAVVISDGTSSLEVVFWNSTGIDIAELNVGQEATFIGVGGQYSSKYQLIVGYQEDFGVVNRVQDDHAVFPKTFELLQPYPNPFNAVTTIQWTLPENADITVEIVNLIGQVVETLYQGNLSAGTYSYTWNADHFASGIYVVRMQAATHVLHQKIVLLK
ncbi:MAG: lamin tail domain-containing protein [Candidatus Marinimicrobia bacterium]|nr:lamin tail domain-containing protein [Candidatus Neomarinimicrobiota bacterium]MDD5582011.1 lamin tail domain-containing protein [Candidatus Neomarinimicrobiota bacterium]